MTTEQDNIQKSTTRKTTIQKTTIQTLAAQTAPDAGSLTTEESDSSLEGSAPLANSGHSAANSTAMSQIDPEKTPDKATESRGSERIRRKFRPVRFIVGLTLTSISVSLILLIAIRMIDVHHLGGRFALVLVAIVVMSSVMMLGAGFGLMATAAADFDDSEFERLIRSGNISSAEAITADAPPAFSSDPSNHRSAA